MLMPCPGDSPVGSASRRLAYGALAQALEDDLDAGGKHPVFHAAVTPPSDHGIYMVVPAGGTAARRATRRLR